MLHRWLPYGQHVLGLFLNSDLIMLHLTFSSLYDQLAPHIVVEASLCFSHVMFTS